MRFPRLRPCSPLIAAVCIASAPAQTLVEYGHAAAGAAKGASTLRKASPAGPFQRLGGVMSSPKNSASPRSSDRAGRPSAILDFDTRPLTVVRLDWGAAEGSPPLQIETIPTKVVSGFEPGGAAPPAPPDLPARGLIRGMPISELSKILGDPDVRTAGLAGRGYDQKLLFRLSASWRVTVFALRGRATAFRPSLAPQKTSRNVLQTADSVIP